MTHWLTWLTFFAALGCALIAGVFFAFSAFVMKALRRLPAHEGIAAMQSINIVVINPLFLGVFLGTAGVCAILPVVAALTRLDQRSVFVAIGAALYLPGTFLVTIAFNVPLNNRLASATPSAPEAVQIWTDYVALWTRWNHVRTAAALAAAASFIVALCL